MANIRHTAARLRAAQTLVQLTRDDSRVLGDVEQRLGTLLASEPDPEIQGELVVVVAEIARQNPEGVENAIDPLSDVLDQTRNQESTANALFALVFLADQFTDAVVDACDPDTVIRLLDDDAERVREGAASLLVHLAERKPEAIRPSKDRIFELTDDDNEIIRGSTAWILGSIGGTRSYQRLKEFIESDPDENVRIAAEGALDEIDPDNRDGA